MLQISVLQKNEFKHLIEAISLEHWNLEKVHLESLYKEFHNDFFVAKKDNEIIGFISALKYADNFGFISNFIILKRYRSLGYGEELFSYAIKHLDDCQIALECDVKQEDYYAKFHFQRYYDSIRYIYTLTDKNTTIVSTTSVFEPNKFLDYHINKLPKKYIQHLVSMAQHEENNFEAIYNEDILSSYGICLNYADGYKVVLASNDIAGAKSIFFSLIKNFKKNTKIYIEVTQLELVIMDLVKVLSMKEDSRMSRMYNKVL